jgi:hypothetical protein
MPSGVCKGCNRITNSTTSNWWFTKDNIPTECYVAWVDNKPVKGCAYNKINIKDKYSMISFYDNIIEGK